MSATVRHYVIDLREARVSEGTTKHGAFYAVFERSNAPLVLAFGVVAKKMVKDRQAVGRGIFSRHSIKMLEVVCPDTGAIIREERKNPTTKRRGKASDKRRPDQDALSLAVAPDHLPADVHYAPSIPTLLLLSIMKLFRLLAGLITPSPSEAATPAATQPTGPTHPLNDPRVAEIIKAGESALAINPALVDLANNRIDTLIREHLPNLCTRHAEAIAHGVARELADQALDEGLNLVRLSVEEAISSVTSEHMNALATEVHFLRLRRNPSAELACIH